MQLKMQLDYVEESFFKTLPQQQCGCLANIYDYFINPTFLATKINPSLNMGGL